MPQEGLGEALTAPYPVPGGSVRMFERGLMVHRESTGADAVVWFSSR